MKNNEEKKIVVPCEIYTRVSGYFRPIYQFNRGKKEEFRQRIALNIFQESPKGAS